MSKKQKILIIIVAAAAVIVGILAIVAAVNRQNNDVSGPFRSDNQTLEGVNDGLLDTVNKFYAEYDTATGNQSEASTAALKKYGTQNAIDNFAAHEKQCIQNTPQSVSADDVAIIESPYKVNVSYNYAESTTTAVVTLINENGTPKIDDIGC